MPGNFEEWMRRRRLKTQNKILKELQELDEIAKNEIDKDVAEGVQQVYKRIKQSSALPPTLKKICKSLIAFSVVSRRLLKKDMKVSFEPSFFEKVGKLIGVSGSTAARHFYALGIQKKDLIEAIKMAKEEASERSRLLAFRVIQLSHKLGIQQEDLIKVIKKVYDGVSN